MPEVSRFYGIVIRMYHDDHHPPHFHAIYGKYEALVAIEDAWIIGGNLPTRALNLVREWASLHRRELLDLWEKARQLRPLGKIAPLD